MVLLFENGFSGWGQILLGFCRSTHDMTNSLVLLQKLCKNCLHPEKLHTIISQNSRNMELFAIFFATLQPLKSQQSRLLSSAHLLVIDDLTNSLISLMSAKTAEGKKKSGKIPYKIFTSSFQEITSNSKYHQWYRSKNIWHSNFCKILNIIWLFLLVVTTNASELCCFQTFLQ